MGPAGVRGHSVGASKGGHSDGAGRSGAVVLRNGGLGPLVQSLECHAEVVVRHLRAEL